MFDRKQVCLKEGTKLKTDVLLQLLDKSEAERKYS